MIVDYNTNKYTNSELESLYKQNPIINILIDIISSELKSENIIMNIEASISFYRINWISFIIRDVPMFFGSTFFGSIDRYITCYPINDGILINDNLLLYCNPQFLNNIKNIFLLNGALKNEIS